MAISPRISLALAFGSLVAGFVPAVLAQSYPIAPIAPARSNSSNMTLSGESLRNIENRTAEDDYRLFFPGEAPVSGSDGIPTRQPAQPSFLTIDRRYEIIFSSPIEYPEYVNQFRPSGDTDASQSVRVRFPVGNTGSSDN